MNLFILLWIIATLNLCDVKAQGFGPGPLDMYKQYYRKFRSLSFNLLGRNSENPANLHKAKQLNVSIQGVDAKKNNLEYIVLFGLNVQKKCINIYMAYIVDSYFIWKLVDFSQICIYFIQITTVH